MTRPRANRSLVDHPARLDQELAVQPWQRATLLLALVATFELVLLIVAGGALLAKPGPHHAAAKQPHVTRRSGAIRPAVRSPRSCAARITVRSAARTLVAWTITLEESSM